MLTKQQTSSFHSDGLVQSLSRPTPPEVPEHRRKSSRAAEMGRSGLRARNPPKDAWKIVSKATRQPRLAQLADSRYR